MQRCVQANLSNNKNCELKVKATSAEDYCSSLNLRKIIIET